MVYVIICWSLTGLFAKPVNHPCNSTLRLYAFHYYIFFQVFRFTPHHLGPLRPGPFWLLDVTIRHFYCNKYEQKLPVIPPQNGRTGFRPRVYSWYFFSSCFYHSIRPRYRRKWPNMPIPSVCPGHVPFVPFMPPLANCATIAQIAQLSELSKTSNWCYPILFLNIFAVKMNH